MSEGDINSPPPLNVSHSFQHIYAISFQDQNLQTPPMPTSLEKPKTTVPCEEHGAASSPHVFLPAPKMLDTGNADTSLAVLPRHYMFCGKMLSK